MFQSTLEESRVNYKSTAKPYKQKELELPIKDNQNPSDISVTDQELKEKTCHGTVLVQGNKISPDSFEEVFSQLKAKVEREAASTTVDSTDSEEDGAEAPPTLPTTAFPPPPLTGC
ncbi:hypothetical protein MHYP_G00193270 [Metynnis hypsauchen]